ncbi:SprT-like domain-containing protein [Hoylesella saccharolytica]|uniref:SprT-like domain-containing protein n=1 Tax=Hoylesella saccharolytica TaxID=633701 RepID=UPI0028E3CF87|nr:SprT-like domain-containing protein [Hoylesella saccharolytica]
MQIINEWLITWFDIFNRNYFDNKLPRPRLTVSHSRTRLGSMSFKRKTVWGRTTRSDYAIHISNYYEQTDREVQNVLLHEMIHYYIAYTGLKDTSPHGILFKGMMNELNRKYGWNITISIAAKTVKAALNDRKPRQYLILDIRLKTNERILSVVNPKYVPKLNSKLNIIRELAEYSWYTTENHYFRDFPQVRSLRGRKVSEDIYNKIKDTMKIVHF